MKAFQIASVGVFVALASRGATAPPPEHKPEDDAHSGKVNVHEGEGEVAVVQPVAILMDNGDVVPLPQAPMGGPEDEMAAHDMEVAAAGYADAYGEYPQMYYGGYGPNMGGPMFYDGEAPEPAAGRHLTQKKYGGYGYGYDAGIYGGAVAMGPRPFYGGRGPMMAKPMMNKPMLNKGFLGKQALGPAYIETEMPYPEQPIYRPPTQPLFDSRVAATPARGYYSKLPSHISCPQGMKCTSKSYYVAAPRPMAYAGPMPTGKGGKYFKRGYKGSKYRY